MRTTPGPWHDSGRDVADSQGRTVAIPVNPSDAPLLAAAPDLLEALRNLTNAVCPDGDTTTLESYFIAPTREALTLLATLTEPSK